MNKFVKYTSIVVLILVVLGIVLLTIGSIGSGVQGVKSLDVLAEKIKSGEYNIDAEDFEKLENLLGKTGITVEDNIRFFDNHPIYTTGTVTLDFEAQEIKRLSLCLAACDVETKVSKDDKIHIRAEHIGKLQAFVEENTFYIINAKSGLNITACELVIELPEDIYFDEIVVDLGAGAMEIGKLQGDNVVVSIGAGEFRVADLEAETLALSVGAGDAEIEDGVLGDVTAEVGAGNIDITAKITGDVKGDVALGNMTMVVKGSTQEDHNYKLDCAMGELSVGSYTWGGFANSDMNIDNGASTTYELECAMGSIDVTFAD